MTMERVRQWEFLCKLATMIPAFVVVAAVLVLGVPAMAQTVATYSFESGTQGWTSFYGATTPVTSNAAAYDGSQSLLTTTSATGTGGPEISLNSVLQAGATYTITGYVKLTSGESATNANFSMVRTDPSCTGGTCYDTIGAYKTAVSDSNWVQIGGSYTVSATETGVTLYAQLVGATSAQSFYLDDVVITETAPPPTGNAVASYAFNGSTDGWQPFGSVNLSSVTSPSADPAGHSTSLLVTNRTAGYMGPSLNLLGVNGIVAGATYQVTAYVRLQTADASGPTVTISTKTTDCANTSGAYGDSGTSAALSDTAWTKVQGTFSYSDFPGPPTSLVLYLQSSSATDSFYVSGVTISEIAPPPPNPSQQDNSGITSTFEDGGNDNWSGRAGSTVTNVTTTAHSGTHSLLVQGRTANYDGPQISVADKMYPGSTYNLSVWVKLVPTDGSVHTINMSLQTTLNGNTSYPSVTPYPGVQVPADGAWHQINVMGYTMANSYDSGQAYLYLQTVPSSGNDLVSFYVDDFQLSYVPPPTIQTNIPSIAQTYSNYFPVGAEIDTKDLTGAHAQLLEMHFNSITPGNDLKWSSVEPSEGTFDYTNGDNEVALAVCHNMLVRGQNLVWATGQQTPSYAFGDGTNSPANQAAVTGYIQEHIKNEVQHFGTKVYAWDVINEPIDPSQPDCLVHGPFYKVLGAKYINIALEAARKYAPKGTKLFINEYSTSDPARLACLVKVVRSLQAQGVPLDGIGHEMHNAINYPSIEAMENSFNTIARDFPNLEQQVTELDESVYNAGDTKANYGNNIPPSVLAEQGWLYYKYFRLFRHLKGKIGAVTLWGMADDDTWLDGFPVTRTDYPLPFDMNLQAKPAYWGIIGDTSHLPGYGLHVSLTSESGPKVARAWTFTAKNGDVGPAYDVVLNGITFEQIEGKRCTPTVKTPGFPVSLGDIATGASASGSVTIDFTGCPRYARFEVTVPWSSSVYHTGKFHAVLEYRPQHRRNHDVDDEDGHWRHSSDGN